MSESDGLRKVTYQNEGHWQDVDECEACGDDEAPTRAIQMREGRTQLLCQDCFEIAFEDDMVHPRDPRLDGGV